MSEKKNTSNADSISQEQIINPQYLKLSQKYPYFVYESFQIEDKAADYVITFHFNISDEHHFYPTVTIPKCSHLNMNELTENQWDNLVFHMGMIEAVSYWKATCSKRFIVKPYHLNEEQVQWWKKIYFHGLGEFFYENKMTALTFSDFMEIESTKKPLPNPQYIDAEEAVLIPIGGGKDSAVTLELLKNSGKRIIPFAINPRKAIVDTIEKAGFSTPEAFFVRRKIDGHLLELNAKGYLNGHTPFSAMVAFQTLLIASLLGIKHIALSNESSANEATIPNTKINHQYSKSFEFEQDFRGYYQQYISPKLNYFSFLRPLNELQIGKLFAQLPWHHDTFRSCNKGSKTNSWCGNCSKCLFTAIILSPFLSRKAVQQIFDKDILDDKNMLHTANELAGNSDKKPFECVGTISDVNVALSLAKRHWEKPLPFLMQNVTISLGDEKEEEMLTTLGTPHFLDDFFYQILKQKL